MGADAKLRSLHVYKKALACCSAAERFQSSLASSEDGDNVCPGASACANTAANAAAYGAAPPCTRRRAWAQTAASGSALPG